MTHVERRPLRLVAAPEPQPFPPDPEDEAKRRTALVIARVLYVERRRRERFFPTDLFGEPTWDILLDLFVAACEDRRVPTTSSCIGAHVPPTTALRWLRILEARGLVEREDDGRDGRRTFVRLSPKGFAAMEGFLGSTRAALLVELARCLPEVTPDLDGEVGAGAQAEAAE